MKTLPRLLVNTLLAVMAVLGTTFCLTSAFSIHVSVLPIAASALASSAASAFCFSRKRNQWLLIPLVLLIFLGAFLTGSLSMLGPTLLQLFHDILTRFSTAYPNISFYIPAAPDPARAQSATALFSVFAALLGVWMSWGAGYRSLLVSVAGTLPFLLLCVVINDTPPDAMALVLVLAAWITILFSRSRAGEPASMDAARTLLTLMAVLLLLGVIGVAYPKDDTSGQALPALIQSILDRLPGPMQNMLSRDSDGIAEQDLGADTSRILDLTQQGVRDRKDTVMLEVSATESGPLYLRGAAKDIYTGSTWESSDEASSAESVYAHTSLGTAFGADTQAAVQIRNLHDKATVLFAPYGYISCTSAESIMSDLRIEIFEDDYTVYYWPGVRSLDISTQRGYGNESYDNYVTSHCLDLPEDTRAALYDLALRYGYDPEMTRAQTIAWVAEFIRSAGEYRLNVSRQPVNFDFALYFLTESKAGYCVHFATAAAAMLRALGVPSRYASGYRVTVTQAGAVTEVTDQDTHAWAEAYLSGLGWIPVETTPGFGETSMLPELEQEIPSAPSEAPAAPSPSAVPPSPAMPSEAPASPSPTGAPPEQTGGGSSGGSVGGGTSLWWIWSVPALLLAGFLTLLIRRQLLRSRRKKAFSDPNSNQAVLSMWQYLSRLTHWGAVLPEDMEALALKAKFSPHTITQEELEPYRAAVFSLAGETEQSLSRWKRQRFRWFGALDLKR